MSREKVMVSGWFVAVAGLIMVGIVLSDIGMESSVAGILELIGFVLIVLGICLGVLGHSRNDEPAPSIPRPKRKSKAKLTAYQ